jgi:DNA mismatch endonuclease (patch repair protein)
MHGTQPRSNSDFWADKITTNRRRDVDTDRRLGREGWRVLRFWEHEDMEACAMHVADVVAARRTRGALGATVEPGTPDPFSIS